jgi:hypothetical protein
MAVLLIPTALDAAYSTQKTRLDGRDYVLRLSYNEREERFYLSILDEEETPLVEGLKLIPNWPLLRHYRYDPRLPPGELMATDLTGNLTPPTIDELGEGRRVELSYFSTETAT